MYPVLLLSPCWCSELTYCISSAGLQDWTCCRGPRVAAGLISPILLASFGLCSRRLRSLNCCSFAADFAAAATTLWCVIKFEPHHSVKLKLSRTWVAEFNDAWTMHGLIHEMRSCLALSHLTRKWNQVHFGNRVFCIIAIIRLEIVYWKPLQHTCFSPVCFRHRLNSRIHGGRSDLAWLDFKIRWERNWRSSRSREAPKVKWWFGGVLKEWSPSMQMPTDFEMQMNPNQIKLTPVTSLSFPEPSI